jgi:hypothetical protein
MPLNKHIIEKKNVTGSKLTNNQRQANILRATIEVMQRKYLVIFFLCRQKYSVNVVYYNENIY